LTGFSVLAVVGLALAWLGLRVSRAVTGPGDLVAPAQTTSA